MYILNIASTIKKMSFNEIGDFKRIGCPKESSYYSMKHQKNFFFYNCLQLN